MKAQVQILVGTSVFLGGLFWGIHCEKLASFSPPKPKETKDLNAILAEEADRVHLPLAIVRAIAHQESNLDPTNTAISKTGAKGTMQLMDFWAVPCGLGHWSDYFGRSEKAVRANVRCGAEVLQYCVEKMKNVKDAFACYYAGESWKSKNKNVQAEARAYAREVSEKIAQHEFAAVERFFHGG